MAGGQVFVMTLGEIDLSIGALFLSRPSCMEADRGGLPLALSVILAVGIGAAIGAVNGFFVAYVGIASFVATLAMLFFLDGLTLIISHPSRSAPRARRGSRRHVRAGVRGRDLLGADLGVGIAVVLQIVLSFTRWGLYTVATGGNHAGAPRRPESGPLVILRNFVLCAAYRRVCRDPRGGAHGEHDPGPVRVQIRSCSTRWPRSSSAGR